MCLLVVVQKVRNPRQQGGEPPEPLEVWGRFDPCVNAALTVWRMGLEEGGTRALSCPADLGWVGGCWPQLCLSHTKPHAAMLCGPKADPYRHTLWLSPEDRMSNLECLL